MTFQVEPVAESPAPPPTREKMRTFPALFDHPSKKPCLFQLPSSVDWYRPPSGWFNVNEPVARPLKRGRDSIDDLTASMKRLRTDSDTDDEEKSKEEEKEPTSTALVVVRPTARCRFTRPEFAPGYSLPPPLASFPVVLYKGPPSPTVGPIVHKPTPEIEELSLLSKDNRTLRVSPSLTIELVDDDDEETLRQSSQPIIDAFQIPLPPSPRSPRVVELDDDVVGLDESPTPRAGMTDD